MPKSSYQKLKLLYIKRILEEKTDENHMITVPQIIEELERYGISAERKSIYDDLEALRIFGLDIESVKTKTTGYYIASREFELPELKLLADAVASSKFITEKKSSELIHKIESLASTYEAKQLQRQVCVMGRVKTINEKIYYNVDTIHQAIAQNKQISFHYFEYTLDKSIRYRNNGEKYILSPLALSWEDENYYLIAYYEKHSNLTHFRVDKMDCVEILDKKRLSLPDQKEWNAADYSKKVFNMFSGQEETLRLQFDNFLIGVVLDRFGKDVSIRKVDDDSFIVQVDAVVSPPLLGWLFSLGSNVRVLEPESLKETMRKRALDCASLYEI